MSAIAAIPLFLALYMSIRRSPKAAFLDVYLPCVLLFPDFFHWTVPGLPDPNFHESAILPIFAVWVVKGCPGWRFSVTDVFLIGFACVVGWSEYNATGYREAQNLMFDMAASVIMPYMLGKAFIESPGIRVLFARRLVWCLMLVAIVCVWEFKMGYSPFTRFLGPFFPGQNDWVTTFRYGLARVAGPYGHAILAGMVFLVGYRVARWLEWSGGWEPKFKRFHPFPWSKARIMSLAMLAALMMTLVRGPWLGSILGAGFTMIGRSKNPRRALLGLCTGLVALGVPAGFAFYQYAAVGRAHAQSDSQETAAYRKELIDKYLQVALNHAALGWGRNTWPKLSSMPSIDNYYLLLALMHGLIALVLFVLIMTATSYRLVRDALARPPPKLRGASLGFTLAGIYIGIGLSVGTVYLGTTVVPLFALITGWAEGYLVYGRAGERTAAEPPRRAVASRWVRVVQ